MAANGQRVKLGYVVSADAEAGSFGLTAEDWLEEPDCMVVLGGRKFEGHVHRRQEGIRESGPVHSRRSRVVKGYVRVVDECGDLPPEVKLGSSAVCCSCDCLLYTSRCV